MSDIQPATPADVERFTGEHAAIPEHMSLHCLDGNHRDCRGAFLTINDDGATIKWDTTLEPCQCPCHHYDRFEGDFSGGYGVEIEKDWTGKPIG